MTADEAFDQHLDGKCSLVFAAEYMGVPSVQLHRWLADGTVPAESWTGAIEMPGKIRIDQDWLADWMRQRGGKWG